METSIRYPNGVPGITLTGPYDEGETRSVRILDGFGSGARFGVHNSSVNNLVRGVAERVLYVSVDGGLRPCPKPKANVFDRLSGFRTSLLNSLSPTTVVPRHDYSSLYDGRKKSVYHRAYESLVVRPIRRSDAYCSTFVKAEKINFSAKGDPAPRVIQPRSPRYNLEVGRYLKCFEKELSRGFKRLVGYNVILKGCNADGVAACIHSNWKNYKAPVAVGLDASRFDQHVSVEALQYEHSIYNGVFRSKELRKLLEWQLKNKGFGRVGKTLVKYDVEGCRMSGDINTGMGNCLIMSSLVLNYFSEVGLDARLSNNGDDCVVICEKSDLYKLDGIGAYFLEFGFNLKRETPVHSLERIEFCQTQPVLVEDAYRMVRNPWIAMSKDCVSLLGWSTHNEFNTWRDAIGQCGLELTRGVPVWESFYRAIRNEGTRQGGVDRIYDSGLGYMARGVRSAVITDESRVSFWRAFGILPDLQMAMEEQWPSIEYHHLPPMKELATSEISYNPLSCLRNKPNL